MIFNSNGLKYPLNIYADAALFSSENEARCYYYHSVSAAVPHNPCETMDYLLSKFFAQRNKLMTIIELLYKKGEPISEAAAAAGVSSEEGEEILKRFYRDLLYFPRYNDILTKGIPANSSRP